jgi:hypothetical protein
MADRQNVTTEPFEVKYPNLEEYETFDGKSTKKYSVTLSFAEGSDGAKKMIEAVAQADCWKGEGHNPIKYKDGRVELKAKSQYEVRIVDAENETINASDISSGDKCRANITLKSYQTGSGKGVTVYLNSIQKLKNREFGTDNNYLPADYGEPKESNDILNTI